MKIWNITDRPTKQLKLSGMVGVSVQVGTAVLKPGCSMEVPDGVIPSVQLALRNGLLSLQEPAPLPAPATAPKAEPVKPVVQEELKTEPESKTEEVTADITLNTFLDSLDDSKKSRRRGR